MKRFTIGLLCFGEAIFLMSSCAPQEATSQASDWRDGGVCYEIFVRSFFDSDGDGVGDLEGLIQKLDYVNDGDPDTRSDLGANCIWLMPVAESPSYHGYDVTDYYRIDPEYGTNEDFKRLIEQAHGRGIRVLIDMVINHMSSQHPIFKETVSDPASPYRNWFRWSETPGPDNEYGDSNWHRAPDREDYYYGFFSPRMPDLNWETAAVREEMKKAATFWLGDMGADGLRLDAVRHLMEDEEGRSTNVPRTHDMLREYGGYVREHHPGSFTVGEVFNGGEEFLAYYPDQLDAYFAFGVSDAILDAVMSGSSAELYDELLRLQETVPGDRYAPFLRNHDQTRTLTYLEGDVERARLAASLLLTMPGIPFVYYGEELGMTGDKPDSRMRTPMHWELGPAAGFTQGVPWEPLQPDSLTANVEVQEGEAGSILSLYQDLIRMRTENSVLGSRAELIPLRASTPNVAAYLRRGGEEAALVVANLGTELLTNVEIFSATGVLPPGRYAPAALLGGQEAAALEVAANGQISGYAPLAELAPIQAYVFALSQ